MCGIWLFGVGVKLYLLHGAWFVMHDACGGGGGVWVIVIIGEYLVCVLLHGGLLLGT